MSVKKEKNYSHLIYNITVWARWMENHFHEVKHELKVKYLEKLTFDKFCYLNDVKWC